MSKPVPEKDKGGGEWSAQKGVIEWWHKLCFEGTVWEPEVALFHIPNGGTRNVAEAARLKQAGVRSGVCDLFLAVPKGPFHGLFVELKRPVGGTTSENQKAFIDFVRTKGYAAFVCHGTRAAQYLISRYLTMPQDLCSKTDVEYDDAFVVLGEQNNFIL